MAIFNIKTLLFTTFCVGSLISYPAVSLAESKDLIRTSYQEISIEFNTPPRKPQKKPPKRGGNPQTSEGTGSRGDCLYKKINCH